GGQGGFGGGGGAFTVGDDFIMTKPAAKPAEQPAAAPASESTSASASSAPKRTAKPQVIEADGSVPAAEFWNNYFAAGERDQAAVRATVRKLMKQGKQEQVIALVQGALVNGQPQPWMFEALGIAMQLSKRPAAEIERAIMSAADFSTTPEDLMLIAHYLVKLNLDSRAIQVMQQVVKLDPQRYDAYLVGLAAAERSGDQDGLRWATLGILSRAWPKGQEAIEAKARRLASATLRKLEEQGQTSAYEDFQRQLADAKVRDCLIRVTWTGDADVDLIVHEPDGSVCSLNQPYSPGGGVMLGDTFASDKGPGLTGFSETYVCPKGFSGDYQARIHRVWGDVTAGVVTVDVYTNYGGPDQQHQSGQVALGNGDSAVKFNLADGRRAEPLDEQQLANAINRQQAISRAVLAQQLTSISDPRVNTLRPDDRERLRRRQLAGARGGGAVGYQPVITVLPDGTQFFVNAVASADRRYVIVRPSPSFTSISDVSTFTFAGAWRNVNNNNNTNTTTTNNNNNNNNNNNGVGVQNLIGRRGVAAAVNNNNNNNNNN
ncbi:MAG: hypothetical protein KDA37_12785, partial [Planctomycetales bacterium]|nr:hypothetical protein [Planctomycetales bacterium]